jgi:hypothetical protein
MPETIKIGSEKWRLGLHRDSWADAWEAMPFDQRRELLRRRWECPPKFIAACARARWCDLPDDVQKVRYVFDLTLVDRCSNALKLREAF